MDKVFDKLEKILSLVTDEDKEKLRLELAKMMPIGEEADVKLKIGWGHHEDAIHVSLGFTVKPFAVLDETADLFEMYGALLKNTNREDLDKLIESFNVILLENPESQTMAVFTSFEIPR